MNCHMKAYKLIGLVVLAGAGIFAVATLPGRAATGLNLLRSPGFEQEGAAWDENGVEYGVPSQSYNWHGFGSGYTRTGALARPATGTFSIIAANATTSGMSGAYQRVELNQTTTNPVYVGGYVRGANVVMQEGSYFGAGLYAEIHLTNGQVVYWNTPAQAGTFDWKWVGFNTAQLGSLITAPIDHIFIVPSLIRASGTAYFDDIVVKMVDTSDATEEMMANVLPPTPTPTPVAEGWQYIRPYGWVYVMSNGYFYYNGRWIRI